MQGLTQENLKNESKRHPNMKVWLASKSAIRHFWSANWHFQSAKWHPFGLWPDALRMTIKYIFFDFFAKRRVPICILMDFAYFLSITASINKRIDFKIQHTFFLGREIRFYTLKLLIFLTPLSDILSLKVRVFRFQR